ncbi:unnamed protein product [Urochloa decumbens]|uniref:PGG domain-containing protein n=1 Tax=Urochloa decumbens TaxID=240449 RepID=A0ABC9AX12_9POAL
MGASQSFNPPNNNCEAPPNSSRMADTQHGNNNAPPATSSMEYQLKKYLLLLATLVATVTYAAGLNPPGGSWLEDSPAERRLAGDSILRENNYIRYIVFYCFNAISFAASVVVSLLLLLLHKADQGWLLKLTRAVMVVDLLGLMGAYIAGGSQDKFTTICAAVLVGGTFAGVVFAIPKLFVGQGKGTAAPSLGEDDLEKHEVVMVLAIFVATIAYVAGLNPPGGFWRDAGGGHAAGDPVLQGLHPIRYKFFFFSNTTAFIASLLAITITVHCEKFHLKDIKVPLYGLIITAILGLGGAYATGSCRDSRHTTYVLALIVPVLVCIFLQRVLAIKLRGIFIWTTGKKGRDGTLDKTREFIQLLAILAATVAYQAGVDPPGGVWADSGEGHNAGDPILLTTHPGRYNVFFYFNSAAFVASLVIMVMLQNERLLKGHALEAAMILDLFGLIGAYAAGSCRDTSTSVYTLAMAGGVLVYVVIHIVFFTLDPSKKSERSVQEKKHEEDKLEKKREVLLLLAILAATLTYQAGLTPPGGLWENNKFGHRAGFPVLQDKYPRRYKAFFYCNAASFMASVALIVLLLNPTLYGPGIRCYALFVCMVAGMFGLIGAYAAGSSLHLGTSIVDLALVVAVFSVVVYVVLIRHGQQNNGSAMPESSAAAASGSPNQAMSSSSSTQEEKKITMEITIPVQEDKAGVEPRSNESEGHSQNQAASSSSSTADAKTSKEEKMMAKYLMLVGTLAASVTYLTGLKPPGGLWREDGTGHSAGNPVLYNVDKHRYNAFFYSNSTSFMASITVIALLLSRMILFDSKKPLWPMHTAMLLDMLALLGAYAAGSARDWCTSKDVILLLFPVLGFVTLLFFWKKDEEGLAHRRRATTVTQNTANYTTQPASNA